MQKRLIILVFVLLISLGLWGKRYATQTAHQKKIEHGEMLARQYCSACHIFPLPELLDTATWAGHTLPWMRRFMGLDPDAIANSSDAEFLNRTGAFLPLPMIPEDDWSSIVAYYLAVSPEQLATVDKPEIGLGSTPFMAKTPDYRTRSPSALMVHIDSTEQRIYVGNAGEQSIDVLTPNGELIQKIPVGNSPVSLAEAENGFYVTSIGYFYPQERPAGNLLFFEKSDEGFESPQVILENLVRPLSANFADLNNDGEMDFVLSLFGNFGGNFSWYEGNTEGNYAEHILYPRPGALRSEVRDLNGDGNLDIAVLIAQSTESLFFMYGDGKGSFTASTIFQKSPVYGHTYFELTDFDRDGDWDVIATNGDNGEYPSPLKPYHGIRIYLNGGNNQFEERFFYPLNGTFKAIARDYDQDGDTDIAVISYFPDYAHTPRESFVYLENQGDFEFTSKTFDQHLAGHWLTMDSGDLDGDGDEDIVLGSVTTGPGFIPSALKDSWDNTGTTIMILENTTSN